MNSVKPFEFVTFAWRAKNSSPETAQERDPRLFTIWLTGEDGDVDFVLNKEKTPVLQT